jgi:hypothetical protein
MRDLKLIALDAEDLAVLSAHLQDAVLRVGDISYLKRQKRFVAVANRFDWTQAEAKGTEGSPFTRRRTAFRFERVLDAKVSGIELGAKDTVLCLLSIEFEPTSTPEGPEGRVTLTFSGGGAIRLSVECIEAELTDLGAAWTTRLKPEHAGSDPGELPGVTDAHEASDD